MDAQTPAQPRTKRVLVVDDEIDNHRSLEREYARWGYACTAVDNADAFFSLLSERLAEFDLLSVDIKMPDRKADSPTSPQLPSTGISVIRRATDEFATKRSLPIVCVTSTDELSPLLDARRAGANGICLRRETRDELGSILDAIPTPPVRSPKLAVYSPGVRNIVDRHDEVVAEIRRKYDKGRRRPEIFLGLLNLVARSMVVHPEKLGRHEKIGLTANAVRQYLDLLIDLCVPLLREDERDHLPFEFETRNEWLREFAKLRGFEDDFYVAQLLPRR